MKALTEKVKRWLKPHRRSRKQAALQNFLISIAMIMLLCMLLPAAKEHTEYTVEEAVEQWCKENCFGEAEIFATLTFDETRQKQVFIAKTGENGERYEARLGMVQEKPWKWACTESIFSPNPKVYDICNYTQEEVKNAFIELEEFTKVDVFDTPTTRTTVDGGRILDVEIIPTVTVDASQEKKIGSVTYIRRYSFCWYTETGEIRTMSTDPVVMSDGREVELWMSEERMKFIAETLMESLPEKK